MLSRLISCVTHREAGRAVHCDEPLAERGKEGRRKREGERGKKGKRERERLMAGRRNTEGAFWANKFQQVPNTAAFSILQALLPSIRPSMPGLCRLCSSKPGVLSVAATSRPRRPCRLHYIRRLHCNYMCKRTRLEVGEATAPNERQHPLIEC